MRWCRWQLAAQDLDFEVAKVCALRPAIGVVILWRYYAVFAESLPYRGQELAAVWSTGPYLQMLGFLLACCCYTVGLLTFVANLLLLVLCVHLDSAFETSTLGTCVAFFLLSATLFMNAHRRWSVDACIGRRVRSYRFLRGDVALTIGRVSALYWIAFLQLAVLHLLALTHHLDDTYWTGGVSFGVMAGSSYLSNVYPLCRWLEMQLGDAYYALLSHPAIALQTLWQATMIALIHWRPGYWFVAAWGWVFALGSLALLQLSYLPWLEVWLWLLLFLRRRHVVWLAARWRRRFGVGAGVGAGVGTGDGTGDRDGADRAVASASEPPARAPARGTISRFAVAVYTAGSLLALGAYAVTYVKDVRLNPLGASGSVLYPREIDAWVRDRCYYLGLWTPNVFNKDDLEMSDQWAVIYRLRPEPDRAPRRELVPYHAVDGHRLQYLGSDRIYFGNSLRWRRYMIGKDPAVELQPGGYARMLLDEMMHYDYRKCGLAGPVRYEVEVYRTRSTDFRSHDPQKWEPELRYAFATRVES